MDASRIEQRLRVLEDTEALRALKARYFFACDRKDPQGMRACFADGKVDIDYGVVGRFDNADALIKIYTEVGCHDYMVEMHHGMNGQISVHDESSASGKWSLHYFLINTKDQTATQLGGYYEDGYRKTAAGWKISSTRFVATSTLVLNLGEGIAKVLFADRPPAAA